MLTFQQAVETTPDLTGAFQKGLGALKTADKPHLAAQDARRLRGSVDLDRALQARCPNDNRWDYGVGHRPENLPTEMVYWIEVHTASAGEIKVVLAKLQWLQAWLKERAPGLNRMRKEFIWVSSGKTSFTLTAPQVKKFALRGLQHKGRFFRIPDQAGA